MCSPPHGLFPLKTKQNEKNNKNKQNKAKQNKTKPNKAKQPNKTAFV